ncbi:hypothetical protein ACTXT7_005253 [Hymenolepis weldensis]
MKIRHTHTRYHLSSGRWEDTPGDISLLSLKSPHFFSLAFLDGTCLAEKSAYSSTDKQAGSGQLQMLLSLQRSDPSERAPLGMANE